MENLTCPNCQTEMKKDEDGDITTNVCPKCAGVFLDKDELNTLATGMSGDIEYCSIDNDFHQDRFASRSCPRCPDKKMKKINLLRLSDLIFDYCAGCGGFFLEKGEIQKMNRELKSLTPNKQAEEYRAEHAGHLVRIDVTGDVVAAPIIPGVPMVQKPQNVRYIRVSVFFGKDMPQKIRVFQEEWPVRLAKGLGLFWGQDIKTGDEKFDSMFRVQGQDTETIARHLDKAARESLINFAESGRSVCGQKGSIEITSSGVAYVEGPYACSSVENVVKRAQSVIEALVEIAGKVEAVPQES